MAKYKKRTQKQEIVKIIFTPASIPESEREQRINKIYRKLYQWTMEKKLKKREREDNRY